MPAVMVACRPLNYVPCKTAELTSMNNMLRTSLLATSSRTAYVRHTAAVDLGMGDDDNGYSHITIWPLLPHQPP